MTVQKLKELLEGPGPKPQIVDVREPWEARLCSLPYTTLIPMGQVPAQMASLDKERITVVVCHHGIRSQRVCYLLERAGFRNLHNLQGGIDAWAREIDHGMATY